MDIIDEYRRNYSPSAVYSCSKFFNDVDEVYGIQIHSSTYQDFSTEEIVSKLHPRSLEAINSAKDIYYRYFVIPELIEKTKERRKSIVKYRTSKRDRKKMLNKIKAL